LRTISYRQTALTLAIAMALTACGQVPGQTPGSVPPDTALQTSASNPGPATELRLKGASKFSDGGAALQFTVIRGGKLINRQLELHRSAGGDMQATLNGHGIRADYFQGREGRLLAEELRTLEQAQTLMGRQDDRRIQAENDLPLPLAVVVGGVLVIVLLVQSVAQEVTREFNQFVESVTKRGSSTRA
jgi:hypothetical protein